MSETDDGFAAFVRLHESSLRRLCWALTGDRHTGEDLAQATLERLWKHWGRVSRAGDPWPYTQRIAVSLMSTWSRRKWRRAETPRQVLPDPGSAHDFADELAELDRVARWLDRLTARQRATVVLRYLCDLSVDETAVLLGCSAGTVKSQTNKALQLLQSNATEMATSERGCS